MAFRMHEGAKRLVMREGSQGPVAGLFAAIVACGNATPAARPPAPAPVAGSASASRQETEPPDGVVPKLRTGALDPVDTPIVRELRVARRHVGDGYETLAVEGVDLSLPMTASIDVAQGQPAPVAFVAGTGKGAVLWIRRASSAGDSPIAGDLFAAAAPRTAEPGHHVRFRVASARPAASDAKVLLEWLRALSAHLGGEDAGHNTAWRAFAAGRLRSLAEAHNPSTKMARAPNGHAASVHAEPNGDLAELMETTTGATAIQEALQQKRPLFIQAAKDKPSVPIASLKGPVLAHHPWKVMLQRTGAAPAEPLASNTPAEFYFVRAIDLPSLFRLFDQVDAWGSPAANVLDGVAEERALAARYETQLALKRGPLTRALGPAVIGEVAVVGSDPYVKEGSDVTVLLRVKNRPLLELALTTTQAELEGDHGKLSHETRQHGGVDVVVARSSDGAVMQQRASIGDLEVVSNSAAAIDVVLDTCKGQHPRLADELDFQFMLARDAKTRADVLTYMGDRFVGEVVGPKQKVLEARRQIAMSELMTPGFAALLYGWMQGKSPVRGEDLFAASLLGKDELKHANGDLIEWHPGVAARSRWGTVASMTPLIDLPAPNRVTAGERAGYERFARAYQESWSAYIDPIALRIAFDTSGKGTTTTVDVRELPLIRATRYREIVDFVGAAHFAPPGPPDGMRVVAGVGADASPRRELEHAIGALSSRHAVTFDWIGEWASIGLADRSTLPSALQRLAEKDLPQAPRSSEYPPGSELEAITTLPLYLEIAVKSTAQAAIALAALRLVANETIPKMFEWGEFGIRRDVPMVRIALKKELASGVVEASADVNIFYALTGGAIIFTMHDWLLRRLIDEQLDGRAPSGVTRNSSEGAQLSFGVGTEPGKGLWTALAWLLEQQMIEAGANASRRAAEALLFGAPEMARDRAALRALALAYFGASPLTPDGQSYTEAKEGVRDPARGTSYAPIWPAVPVEGSPVAKLLGSLSGLRTQLAFDDEGRDGGLAMVSLHARAAFDLR
jgi:hypothetical protein